MNTKIRELLQKHSPEVVALATATADLMKAMIPATARTTTDLPDDQIEASREVISQFIGSISTEAKKGLGIENLAVIMAVLNLYNRELLARGVDLKAAVST